MHRTPAFAAAIIVASAAAAGAQPVDVSTSAPQPAATIGAPQSADVALAMYRAALDALPEIGNVVFEYTESRIGPSRALAEVHRVYRSAEGDERNETISVDGASIVPAISQFSVSAQWPYDVRALAVDAADYEVMPLGPATVDGRRVLSYSAVRTSVGDFAVTHLYLDPLRHLPVREGFTSSGGGCSGSGTIDFGPVDRRWMPTEVSVSCTVSEGGAVFKETIKFAGYRFLAALPSDVFSGAAQ